MVKGRRVTGTLRSSGGHQWTRSGWMTKLYCATQQISIPRKYLSYARYDAAMAIAQDLEVAPFLKSQPKKLFIGGQWVESWSA